MKNKFRLILALVSVVAAVLSVVGVTGCDPTMMAGYYYPEYESGYFKYAVKTEKDGTEKAYLIGLTESGMEQTELIYPEEIDGITVYGIGYSIPRIPGYENVGMLVSSKLKKLYFPNFPEDVMNRYSTKIENAYSVYWNSANQNRISFANAAIYSYNYYLAWIKGKAVYNSNNFIANISYLFNYEEAQNDGYYWVDSYNESVITFIPPEPKREGYKFDGWYKEADCINKWDFENDKTGKEIVLYESKVSDVETYDGLYLYAKWIKV